MPDPRIAALAALATLALAAPSAEAQPALCHYDDPAPFLAALEDPTRGRDSPDPACAPEASATEAPAELVLPLPCGHKLYLRRIDVPVRDLLDHFPVFLGDANANARTTLNKVSSIPRSARLSGSFFREGDDGTLTSYYYIGKYELSAPQWRLYEEGLFEQGLGALDPDLPACRAHLAWVRETQRPVNVLPAGGLTWFDANAYARALTLWLMEIDAVLIEQGSPPLLPWRDGTSGFVRLPTDVEWEYAARGGSGHVSREALSRALYPVWDGERMVQPELRDVAQTEGLRPPLQPTAGIGKRAPNPLGLHDTLGNVEELVLDLFRPTRPDGLKGQVGGTVLRGGSTLTQDSLIGLGYRQEAPLFGPGGEVRSATVGVRLAIAAPYFVAGFDPSQPYAPGLSNEEQFARIEAAAAALGTETATDDGATADMGDFLARAEGMDLAALSPEARALIQEARLLVEQSRAEQIEAERAALRERFITAATLSLGIDRTGANVRQAVQSLHSNLFSGGLSEALRQRVIDNLPRLLGLVDEREAEVDVMFAAYVENVAAILEAPKEDRRVALTRATEWVSARNAVRLQEAMGLLTEHLRQVSEGTGAIGEATRSEWLFQVDGYREEREEMTAAIREEVQ